MALQWNKYYDGWEEDFKSTKRYIPTCAQHTCTLGVVEDYLFAQRQNDGITYRFDEDEVDLSGFVCPHQDPDAEVDCSDFWGAIEVTE